MDAAWASSSAAAAAAAIVESPFVTLLPNGGPSITLVQGDHHFPDEHQLPYNVFSSAQRCNGILSCLTMREANTMRLVCKELKQAVADMQWDQSVNSFDRYKSEYKKMAAEATQIGRYGIV